MTSEEEKILSLLKGVIDPELMVNIIDLGLVYAVKYNESEKTIAIEMTLTSPGCPLGDAITADAQEILRANYPGFSVEIKLVWEPHWNPDRLTPEGKKSLGGF